jgi:hypothetical protein
MSVNNFEEVNHNNMTTDKPFVRNPLFSAVESITRGPEKLENLRKNIIVIHII